MKPYPLVALNHLTVPIDIEFLPENKGRPARARRIKASDLEGTYRLLVDAVPKPTRKKFDRADIIDEARRFKLCPRQTMAKLMFLEGILQYKVFSYRPIYRRFSSR